MQVMAVLRQVFASPDVRRVQGGWLLSITAEWVYLVNLLVLAYLLAGVFGVGLVGMLRTLPAALLGPMLATVTDRFPRHRVLLAVHLGRFVAIALVAIAALGHLPAPLIFAAALLEGIIATLNRATTMALMPALARSPQELVAANVSVSLAEGMGLLLGPALGGLLAAGPGPQLGLVAGSVGFGLAGLAVLGVKPAQSGVAVVRPPAKGSRMRELFSGFLTMREHPHVGIVIGTMVTQTFVRGILTVLLVAVAVELLLLGEGGVGFLNSAIGAGGLLGAVLALALVTRRSVALPMMLGLAFWGLPIAALGLFPSAFFAFALMGVVGVANAVLDIAGFTLLQRTAPNHVRGRVLATLEGMVALTVGLGSIAAPVLVVLVGLQGALILTGLLLPITAVVALRWVRAAEGRAIIPERELDLLRGVPMFAPLPMTALEGLATSVSSHTFGPGTDVVTQGERGDCFYIIAKGQADVMHDGRRVAALVMGDGFGEIALLRDVPRTATVRAMTELDVLRVGREEFLAAVTGSSQGNQAADVMVGSRLQQLGHDTSAERQ